MYIFRYIEKGTLVRGFSRQSACQLVCDGLQIPASNVAVVASYTDDDIRHKSDQQKPSTSARGYQAGREWGRAKKRYNNALHDVKSLDCGHIAAYYISVQSVPLGESRTSKP